MFFFLGDFSLVSAFYSFALASSHLDISLSLISTPQLSQRLDAPTLSDTLATAPKTFLEKRSWLASVRAFSRLYSFYFAAFEVLVCMAFLDHYGVDATTQTHKFFHVLASAALCGAVLTIGTELLEIWGAYELMRRRTYDLFSCTVRLLLKTAAFSALAVLYTWSWERAAEAPIEWLGASWSFYDLYLLVAAAFSLPYVCFVLCAVFPSLSIVARSGIAWRPWQAFRRFWWPATRTFVGKSLLVTERLAWRYQLFWASLLALKFWCSYTFQVQPLVAPTLELLFDEPLQSDPLFPGFNLVLVALLWLPFVFVYLLDAQIWCARRVCAAGRIETKNN